MFRNDHTYLNAANVSTTSFKDGVIFLPKLAEWVQAPAIALPDQAKNGREIVRENDETKPTAVDRSRDLEDFLFLVHDDFGAVFGVRWNGVWILPRSALIDLQELLGDILNGWETANERVDKERSGSRGAHTL